MNKIGFSLMLGCLLEASLEAQPVAQPSANTNVAFASVAPTIVGRSADSRIWGRITSQTDDAGQVSLVTNRAFTELASGLCVQGVDGTWTDAAPVISSDNVLGGASATGGQIRVHFAPDANTAGGAVDLITPDKKEFLSRVYGLAYWDSSTGSNVLIAPLQSSQGQLLGSQRVVYLNAFSNLHADIEYVVSLAGLEQNIVLRAAPNSPAAYGLNPATTRLQVYSEFFVSPVPIKTSIQRNGVAEDVSLDFGAVTIGMGEVLSIQPQGERTAIRPGRVSKHWVQLDNRQFLVEEIPYAAIANSLEQLPPHASNGKPGNDSIKRTASLFPLLPREFGATGKTIAPMLLANAAGTGSGLIIDYTTVSGRLTNYLFQNDTTYYVSGTTYLWGTNIFEGGTVTLASHKGQNSTVIPSFSEGN